MSEPRRKRHRRGKRGGRKSRHRLQNTVPAVPPPAMPLEVVRAGVSDIRRRLAKLSQTQNRSAA